MNRILGLDGIRAYAALMVVVSHMYLFIELYNNNSPYYSLVRGIIGVKIFFILSGFLITNLLYKEYKKYGRISLKLFIIRRGLRIFPVFYLFILAVLIIGLFFETMVSPKQLFYASIYWFNHLPRDEYSILLGHTWSLAVEEHFYILWPPIFILMLRVKLSPTVQIFILLSLIYFLQLLENSLYNNEEISSTYRVSGWTSSAAIYLLVGCVGGIMLHTSWWEKFSSSKFISIILAVSFFIGYLVDFWYGEVDIIQKYLRIIGILAGILWIVINQESLFVRFLELKPIAYLGQVSYGIYVWQGFYLATGPGRASGQEWPLKAEIEIQSLTSTGFILLCITVPISYHLFEVKFLKLKDRFRPNYTEL